MDLNIESEGQAREVGQFLEQLAAELKRYNDLTPQVSRKPAPSEKFTDIATAIALSNLALSTATLVINLLKYKAETNPNITATMKRGNGVIELKNASQAEIDAFLRSPQRESVYVGIRERRGE